MKSRYPMPVKQPPKKSSDLKIFVFSFVGLALGSFLILHFLPRRDVDGNDVARIIALTNLEALPSGYQVAEGHDMSNARSVWIDHLGSPLGTRVLVTVIEATDPSAKTLERYYAIHPNEKCRSIKDDVFENRGRKIRVERTVCNLDEEDEDVIEEQAVFHMSDYYSVSLYESSTRSHFDESAFQAVLDTVLQSAPKGNGSHE